jgi:hypothetical protein
MALSHISGADQTDAEWPHFLSPQELRGGFLEYLDHFDKGPPACLFRLAIGYFV